MKLMNPNEIANASINLKAIETLAGRPVSPMLFNQEELGSRVMDPNEIYNAALNLNLIDTYRSTGYRPYTGVFKVLNIIKSLMIVGGIIVAIVALLM